MKSKPLLLGVILGWCAVAGAAKPPAYTFEKLGFPTSLRGIPEGERRAECLDQDCTERGGVLVAEGKTTTLASPVTVKIREHRQRGAGKKELQALAKRLVEHAPRGKAVQTTTGQVADRPTLTQWSVWDGCQRVISGRVLVAMPDKIIEVETRSVLEPGHDQGDSSVKAMGQILKKLRVRRLGDAPLDPTPTGEQVTLKELAEALPRSCAR
jgi:hypothetical protein